MVIGAGAATRYCFKRRRKMTDEVIKVKNLKKYFPVSGGVLHAVDGVTLSIRKGKPFGVVGESGCGKSTLGRTIIHLHERTSGEIFLNGENISDLKRKELRKAREKMQIIFQDPYCLWIRARLLRQPSESL